MTVLFVVFCAEQVGIAMGVFAQSEGQKPKPVAYYSKVLDPVAQGYLTLLKSCSSSSPYGPEN